MVIYAALDKQTKPSIRHYQMRLKATMQGVECWTGRKKKERKLRTTEMCMLWCAGRKTNVRNVDIWNEEHMHPMAEFLREMVWACAKAG